MAGRERTKRARSRAGQPKPRLSPERAFVLQLEGARPRPGGKLAGRVEHLESGEARHFASIQDVVAFMARFPARGRARRPRA